jgi:hypothetical protein
MPGLEPRRRRCTLPSVVPAGALLAALVLTAGSTRAAPPTVEVVARDGGGISRGSDYLTAEARQWTRRDGLVDVDFASGTARDLSPELSGAELTRLALPWPVAVDGGRYDSLLVGHGWIRFVAEEPHAAELPGSGALGPRIDVLAGEGVRSFGQPVPCRVEARGVAIRWTGLTLPQGGTASVELILDRAGHVTVQYLRLPQHAVESRRSGILRAGTSGAAGTLGLDPEPASAFTLFQPVYRIDPIGPIGPIGRLPVDPPRPEAGGPPPDGCEPPAGTWCELVDDTGLSRILVQDTFDDQASTARGWTATGLWHETTWPVCVVGPPGMEVGGADANPGAAWYFGEDATCQYLDDQLGVLESPLSPWPVTTATVGEFLSRIGWENPADSPLVLLNGIPAGSMPAGLDPDLWYNLRMGSINEGQPFFPPFLGARVRVGFRFISDASNSSFLGWFVDDVRFWDEFVGKPACLLAYNGTPGLSPCDTQSATTWSFRERARCASCRYTFHVTAECGSELHFPLFGFEGGEIRVTNAVTGEPVSLRCVSSTAKADAGLGDYEYAAELTCPGCVPEEQQWWGPPFDETDNLGPGHVGWGFPTCDGIEVYDEDDPPDGVQCNELTCGFPELADLSPGAAQTMDCFIEDPDGLCGMFRVDVTSGAGLWDFYANCDGSDVPDFVVHHDCTAAWAAWDDTLIAVAGPDIFSCSGQTVLLDGSATELGPCTDAQYLWLDEMGNPLAPPSSDPTLPIPFNACPGGRELTLEVSCPEATCTSRDVVRVECLLPQADAGSDVLACQGDVVVLDGSGSTVPGCAQPEYRWLDGAGGEVQPWGTDPTLDLGPLACADAGTYTLEVRCQVGGPCSSADAVVVGCVSVATPVPTAADTCGGPGADLACGVSEPGVTYWWDVDTSVDADGDGDPGNDVDLAGCDVSFTWPAAGTHGVRAWARHDAQGCTESAAIAVDVFDDPLPPSPSNMPSCSGLRLELLCGVAEPGVSYSWDVDVSDDADGDGDPRNDRDHLGCDVSGGWPAPGPYTVRSVALDARGCTAWAEMDVEVLPGGLVLDPATTSLCTGASAELTCGTPEPGALYWWDSDPLADADGDGNFTNDQDLAGCDVLASWPGPTAVTVTLNAEDPGSGCRVDVELAVEVFDVLADPVPAGSPACGGPRADLACGPAEPGVTYTWDLDVMADADGDGDPANDADLTGCDVTAEWPDEGVRTVRVRAERVPWGCVATADTAVEVFAQPAAPAPAATPLCGGPRADLACGVAEAGMAYTWDLDITDDADGDGDPANDDDLAACDGTATWPAAGSYTARARATHPTTGCVSFADLAIEVHEDPLVPTPTAAVLCTGASAALSCGAAEPGVLYTWDLDVTDDADGDGDPANDADLSGCDVPATWPDEGSRDVRVRAERLPAGCVATADLGVLVFFPPAAPVPEASYPCGGRRLDLTCGVAEPGVSYTWDTDAAFDSDFDGDPGNDPNLVGCDARGSWPAERAYTVVANATHPTTGCVIGTPLVVEVVDDPRAPVPTFRNTCFGLLAVLECGVTEPGVSYGWDVDVTVDSDGDGDAGNDRDEVTCDVFRLWDAEGSYTVRASATDPITGCVTSVDLVANVRDDPPALAASAIPGCAGVPSELTCGAAEPGVTYEWDLDVTVDSGGDGFPANDVDALGCDQTVSLDAPTTVKVVATDSEGCFGETTFLVDAGGGVPPGEVADLRVSRSGAELTLDWAPSGDAPTYRVLRGDLGSWSDPSADDATGRGACDTAGATTFTDRDDVPDPVDYYYLVVGSSPCTGPGTPGRRSTGTERPVGASSCP